MLGNSLIYASVEVAIVTFATAVMCGPLQFKDVRVIDQITLDSDCNSSMSFHSLHFDGGLITVGRPQKTAMLSK